MNSLPWVHFNFFTLYCIPISIFPFQLYWGTSLVVEWLRVCLPVQGTGVRALVREDPTRHRAAGPTRHNCWACALGLASHSCWAHVPQLLRPRAWSPCSVWGGKGATAVRSGPRSPQLEKAHEQQGRPNTAKNK